MLQNFLTNHTTWTKNGWSALILIPAWVLVGFLVSVGLTRLVVSLLIAIGVPLDLVNEAVYGFVASVIVYTLTIAFVVGLPLLLKRSKVSLELIGLTRLPTWKDIGLAPAGFVIYFIASALSMVLVAQYIPGVDLNEVQDVGFKALSARYEYILAFLALVIVAPIAEEVLFRGYLYGKLRRAVPTWVAIVVTSALFGLVHGQWNIAIDVFILSLVLCSLREVTGSIVAGILLHMLKNGLAFYLLFINPSLLHTLGG